VRAQAVGRDTTVGTFRVAGYPEVDFHDFHRRELPRRLADGGNERIAWDVAGSAPFALTVDGASYSYVAEPAAVRIVAGVVADAEVVIGLDRESWQDYVYEFRTRFGLLYSRAVEFVRGDFDGWDRWEPAIRAMYSGRAIYDPGSLDLRDLEGRPLDLHRSFTTDDRPEDLSHFLQATGYLVVRQAFGPDRIAEIGAEVDRLRDQAREGEFDSWWAADGEGRRFPYRLTFMGERSATLEALNADPTVQRLTALGGQQVVPVSDRVEGLLAVLKDFGTDPEVTGFANLPWHKDCGLGGCQITCPSVLVGVQLDAANRSSSQLTMMAGSWGKACHDRPTEAELARLPVVELETEAGDATVHMGCGLHAGMAPTGPNRRRTVYVQSYNPRVFDFLGRHQGYQQIIPGYGQGTILNVEEVQAQVD